MLLANLGLTVVVAVVLFLLTDSFIIAGLTGIIGGWASARDRFGPLRTPRAPRP